MCVCSLLYVCLSVCVGGGGGGVSWVLVDVQSIKRLIVIMKGILKVGEKSGNGMKVCSTCSLCHAGMPPPRGNGLISGLHTTVLHLTFSSGSDHHLVKCA